MTSQSQRKFRSRALQGVVTGRNPNYLDSVLIGLERGIWQAPTFGLGLFAPIILGLIALTLFLIIGLPIWVIAQLGIVIMGLTGRLRRENHVPNNQSAVN